MSKHETIIEQYIPRNRYFSDTMRHTRRALPITIDQVLPHSNEYLVPIEAIHWKLLYLELLEAPSFDLRVWVRLLQYDGTTNNCYFILPHTTVYDKLFFVGICDDSRTVSTHMVYNIVEEYNRSRNLERRGKAIRIPTVELQKHA